jgi:hypothetical protein
MWDDANPTTREEAAEVFTGAVGGLLWQMPVQDRTRALFYTQAFRTPFMIGPERTDVEFVTLIDEETWRNRQGAFVIRSFREERSHRGHPFRAEPPQVQMFFPLAANGTLFDVSRGVTFPVARYAAALGLKLSVHGGTLQWSAFPAADFSRRSFVIVPTEITEASRTVEADLDVTDAVGSRKVSFSFQIEPIPGQPSGPRSANFKIESVDVEGRGETLLTGEAPHPGSSVETSIQPITVDLPASATGVRISIADVPPQEMVRLIELKLSSDDVQPTLATTFCQGG